jgi:hypothetical protein
MAKGESMSNDFKRELTEALHELLCTIWPDRRNDGIENTIELMRDRCQGFELEQVFELGLFEFENNKLWRFQEIVAVRNFVEATGTRIYGETITIENALWASFSRHPVFIHGFTPEIRCELSMYLESIAHNVPIEAVLLALAAGSVSNWYDHLYDDGIDFPTAVYVIITALVYHTFAQCD